MSAYEESRSLVKRSELYPLSKKEYKKLMKIYDPPPNDAGFQFWKKDGFYYAGISGPTNVDMDTGECDYNNDIYKFNSFKDLLNFIK